MTAALHPSAALARQRAIVVASLGAVIVLAWAYLLWMAWGMQHMDVGASMLLMPRMTDWGPVDLLLVFLMWAVMMAAMMLPSALPMVLAYGVAARDAPARARVLGVAVFVAGSLAIWRLFSAIMTLLQWGLLEARLVSPMMQSRSPWFGGAILVAAGLFQLTPLKNACLANCRSPLSFLITGWRPGIGGAWSMGLRHGLYCTGCCWLLMALLFLLGVMNVAWIAALTAFVLLEKLVVVRWTSLASGLLLIGWGATLLARAWLGAG
jgi:predicted metal-binding membrane protein